MTMKWILFVLFQYDVLVIISPTIAGLTYMDRMDFEEKYKDVHECDPFYWHPLHLPEICADMFEKLIRSRIAKNAPVRVMRARHPLDDTYPVQTSIGYDFSYPMYEIGYSKQYKRPLTPYEKMLNLLKKDIEKDPSYPKLGMHPNFGPVAIYNQEISKRSESMIKELATAYAKIGQKSYANYMGYNDSPDPQLYIWDSEKNRTKEYKDKNNKKKNKKKDRITRTRTKQGGVVTIMETLEPRRRRRAAIFFSKR